MDFEVVWTEPATEDLAEVVAYISRYHPIAAERTAAAILDRVELLKAMPFMGSVYPPDSGGRHREIVSGKHRIFYRVVEAAKRIEILTVWHSARREPKLPE